jgi:GNAT superfamily N-acetyltransferase
MTTETSLRDIDAHWSGVLGRDVSELPDGRCAVGGHSPALAGFRGVYAWARHDSCVVSAPVEFTMDAARAAAGKSAAEIIDSEGLPEAFGERVDRVVGPAAISYADVTDFILHEEQGARPLTPADMDALRALSKAVGEEAWENGGIAFDRVPIFGIYEKDKMIAAASYERWGERILHIGVVTHPEYRGQGYGMGVATATTVHALEAGGIAQWQTLESNGPSVTIAAKLGFKPYCRTLVVRLK